MFISLILSLVSILISCILPIYYFLCSMYRSCISLLVKLFKPNFGLMLDPPSTVFCDDDYTSFAYNAGLCCSLQLEGLISLEELSKSFQENVLSAQLNSFLRYPQLKQYYGDYLGCGFWKTDLSFDPRNHILNEKCPSSIHDLEGIHQCYVNRAFSKKRSPWELILIDEFYSQNENKSLVIFRIHHSLGDAKSICQLLMGCLAGKEIKSAKGRDISQSRRQNFLNFIRLPWDLAAEIKSYVGHMTAVYNHPFKVPDPKLRMAPVNVGFSDRIPMDELRSLARQAGVRPAALIYCIVGRTLGKLREEFGATKEVPLFLTLNKKNHPGTLINHFNVCTTTLSTDPTKPIPDQIQSFNTNYEEMNSVNPVKCASFLYRVGGVTLNYPRRMTRAQVMKRPGCLLVISNLAFDEDGFSVGERTCSDFRITCGCSQMASVGLYLFPQSYQGGFRYSVMASSSLLDEEEIRKLASMLSQEYGLFKKEICIA